MMRRRALLVVLAFLGLSGCWLQPGYGPERQNSNPLEEGLTEDTLGGLHEAWAAPVAVPLGSQPLVTGVAVYLGGVHGTGEGSTFTVLAVNRSTGAPRWRRDLPIGPFPGRGAILSVAGDEVLTARIAPTGSELVTFDAATGTTLGTVPDSRLVDPDTAVVNHAVVAHRAFALSAGTYSLVVRDRDTLAQLWTAPIGAFTLGSGDPLIIADGRLYVRDQDTTGPVVKAFDVAGCGAAVCAPVWTAAVPPPAAGETSDATLLAATDDGHILLRRTWNSGTPGGPFGHDLVALTTAGTTAWEHPLSELTGVAVAGDEVFVVGRDPASLSGDNALFAITTATGSLTWQAAPPLPRGTPVVAGGLVYVEGDAPAPDVFVFDADGCGTPTCDDLAVLDTGPGTGGIYAMTIAGSTFYVNKAGPAAHLIAYRPQNFPASGDDGTRTHDPLLAKQVL